METLERPSVPARMNDDSPFDPLGELPRRRWWPRFWRRACAFVTVAGIALASAGLTSLKNDLYHGWQTAAGNFKWIVLVTGDAVDIDEVGRFLKEMDGVGAVTLQPSASILGQLRDEPLLGGQIAALDAAALPSIWTVTWLPDFDIPRLATELDDLKRLPAVVDVAFDARELDKVNAYRLAWLKVRVLLSTLAVLGAVVFAVLLGRFLFFSDVSLRAAPLLGFAAGTAAAWLAGLGLCAWLVGPVDWRLAWGALAAAIARLAWGRVREAE